jgi:hypothetical protein
MKSVLVRATQNPFVFYFQKALKIIVEQQDPYQSLFSESASTALSNNAIYY